MKVVRESLNEEIVGRIDSVIIYKNPPSIKRMGPYLRGFHDQDGNFYVGDSEEKKEYGSGILHTRLMSYVRNIDRRVKTEYADQGYQNGIAWEQIHRGVNEPFYLSVVHDINDNELMEKVYDIMSLPTFFKPHGAEFRLFTE